MDIDYPDVVENSAGTEKEVPDAVKEYFAEADYEPQTDSEYYSSITKFWANRGEYLTGKVPVTSVTEDDEHQLRRRAQGYKDDLVEAFEGYVKLKRYRSIKGYEQVVDTILLAAQDSFENTMKELENGGGFRSVKEMKI